MIYSANLAAILIPAVLIEYGCAPFCLIKLVFLDLPKKRFWLWNFFILLVVGIGFITFLVCYYGFRDKVFPKAAREVTSDPAEKAASDPATKETPAEQNIPADPDNANNQPDPEPAAEKEESD